MIARKVGLLLLFCVLHYMCNKEIISVEPCRRRRPALSCLECRRRKIKCDRTDPCAHCVSAKTRCTYKIYRNESAVRQQSQQDTSWAAVSSPSAYASSPVAPFQQFRTSRPTSESLHHASRTLVSTLSAAGRIESSNPHGRLDFSPPEAEGVDPDLRNLLLRVQKLEQSSTSSSLQISQNGRNIFEPQTSLQESQIMLNKTRILGWSRFMGEVQEFETIIASYIEVGGHGNGTLYQGAETRALLVQIGDHLDKCKRIAKRIKVGRPSRSLQCPGFDLTPPSREVADSMMNLYFRSFESTHRILHVPTFWTESQRFWSDPESIAGGTRLKILLVIGIGSSLRDHGESELGLRNMVHHWIYAAQTWLSGPLEKDRLDITGLQVHCLTILARQIFSIGGDLVWMSMGSLIHRAMQIGLHRDPKRLPTMSIVQAEIRRRLWASILEFVVQSSLDSGMPPRITFDEFDTEAPSNINDNELVDPAATLQPRPQKTYTMTSIQLVLHSSLPTRLKIVQLLNSLRSELSYLDVLALSSEIVDACRAANTFVKENEKSGVTPFHGNMLDHLLRRFLILLHCPFAVRARSNPLFYYSRKVILDAAMAMISPNPDEEFSHLMAIGGGLFREGIRYASTVVSIELLALVETQSADGTLHRNSQDRELLKKAIRDMISLSAERIRQGETNIKSHMFLSMVLGQVEAMEAGTSCEFKIAQTGRDSAEFCHDLLQTRLDNISLPSPSGTGVISTGLGGGQEGYGLDLDFDWGLDFALPDSGFT